MKEVGLIYVDTRECKAQVLGQYQDNYLTAIDWHPTLKILTVSYLNHIKHLSFFEKSKC